MSAFDGLFDDKGSVSEDQFDEILKNTLGYEGGFTVDHAGPTNHGITQSTFDRYRKSMDLDPRPVETIRNDEVYDLYRSDFYEVPKIDKLPKNVAGVVFDFGVNSSPERAIKTLQRTVGATPDGIIGPKTLSAVNSFIEKNGESALVNGIIDKRQGFLKKLIEDKPEKYGQFENGWNNRLNDLRDKFGKVMSNMDPFGSPAYADEVPEDQRPATWDSLFSEAPGAVSEPESKEQSWDGLFGEPEAGPAEQKRGLKENIGDAVKQSFDKLGAFVSNMKVSGMTLRELGSSPHREKSDLDRIIAEMPEVSIRGIKESFKRGYVSAEIDQASYRALTGELDYEKDVKPLIDQQKAVIEADPVKGKNALSKAIYAVAEMSPALLSGMVEGAGIGAGAGLAVGATGVGAPLALGAFSVGQVAGSFEYWRRQGAGQLYSSLKEKNIPDNIAKPTSHIAGALYGAVEFSQVDKLIPGIDNAVKRYVSDSLAKTVQKMAVKYGADWVQEVGEEGIQEIVMATAEEVSQKIAGTSDKANGKIVKDVLVRGWDTAKESALPMLLLMGPRAGVEGVAVAKEEKLKGEIRREMARRVIEEIRADVKEEAKQKGLAVDEEGRPIQVPQLPPTKEVAVEGPVGMGAPLSQEEAEKLGITEGPEPIEVKPKEAADAGQNVAGMEGRVEEGQEPVKAGPVEGAGEEEARPDRVSEKAEEVKPTRPEDFPTAKAYVASKKKLYHGTKEDFDTFDIERSGEIQPSDWGQGAYFTDNPEHAKSFAKVAGGDVVLERYAPDVKFADGDKLLKDSNFMLALDDEMGFTSPAEYLAEKGFGGIKFKNPQGFTEYVVFDPKQIKTKSQLISEWQAARGKK